MRASVTIRNPWGIFWQAEASISLSEEEQAGSVRIVRASKIGKKHFSLDRALDEAHKLREELIEQYVHKESA